jgi:hypothetical protein
MRNAEQETDQQSKIERTIGSESDIERNDTAEGVQKIFQQRRFSKSNLRKTNFSYVGLNSLIPTRGRRQGEHALRIRRLNRMRIR